MTHTGMPVKAMLTDMWVKGPPKKDGQHMSLASASKAYRMTPNQEFELHKSLLGL